MIKSIGIVAVFTFLILFLVLAYKMVTRPADIKTENSTQSQPILTETFKIQNSICTFYKIGEEQRINSIKKSTMFMVCDPPLVGVN
jgi:hypothetical protein